MKENKHKSKKRKQETLVRNGQALASFLTGSAAEDRFSVPNPSKIRKAELSMHFQEQSYVSLYISPFVVLIFVYFHCRYPCACKSRRNWPGRNPEYNLCMQLLYVMDHQLQGISLS